MKRIAVYALAVVAGLVAPFVAAASMFAPVTIPAAVVFQSAVHTGRVDTFRMPSSSMEPTLHCARPAHGCQADRSDRFMTVDWGEPGRGDIIVFETPPEAVSKCGAGGTFVKRVVGLPGERVDMRLEDGVAFVYVDGRRLDEPYIENDRRDIGRPNPSACRRTTISCSATTARSRATRACGAPYRPGTFVAASSSATGRRAVFRLRSASAASPPHRRFRARFR